MRHLFVADLDDTLLTEGKLPPGTAASLRRVIQSGVHFTVATARGIRAAVAPLDDAVPKLPIIALRGAVVACADGTQAVIEPLALDTAALIARIADELGAARCLITSTGRDEVLFAPPVGDEFTDWSIEQAHYFNSQAVVRGRPPTEAELPHVVRLVICSTIVKAKQIDLLIGASGTAVSTAMVESRDKPGFAWLEIGAPTATKAHAVKGLASRLGYAMNDVVYYGDAANDLDAMAIVGEAVAVANAEPDVLEAADRIIDEAGTGAVVRDLLRRLNQEPVLDPG